ncbi:MAG: alpha-glucosidase [Candidatus Izemoplasmatales bacterium]|nr:alpha-glucosidase [Candidatus Izemoplasmatales bacterium]
MKKAWYREGIVYQIYPRSFQDSNDDGIGDLQGIISRIPYLVELGINIVWLSPVYASPNDDNGYDISDYTAIHPDFGTMSDMKQLISALHQAGIRLVMDLVVNHTSDEHPWFQASANNDPEYLDFYHWKQEKSNWGSFFGGEAWTYHPTRQAYYLHLFSKKQPDLNWDNPRVREAVKKILRFWLDLGVDGFRCDVINIIAKADGLPRGRFSPILSGREHYLDHPKIHGYLQELRNEVFSHYDCFTVGETVLITPEKALSYIDEDIRELDMVFQFEHMGADNYFVKWFMKKFRPINLKRPLAKWQNALQGRGWNTLYLENHDQPRSVSRFGSTAFHQASAKMLATMIYFQQGTPFIYQGQEIGMENAEFPDLADYQDIETHNIYRTGRKWGLTHQRMMNKIRKMSRDNARTPMQWDSSLHAGFSPTTPWLKVNPNYLTTNVATNLNNDQSILKYYQKIIALRKGYPVIVYGDYHDLYFSHSKLYAYQRTLGPDILTVYCNFSDRDLVFKPLETKRHAQLLLTNVSSIDELTRMKPYEARVYLEKK